MTALARSMPNSAVLVLVIAVAFITKLIENAWLRLKRLLRRLQNLFIIFRAHFLSLGCCLDYLLVDLTAVLKIFFYVPDNIISNVIGTSLV